MYITYKYRERSRSGSLATTHASIIMPALYYSYFWCNVNTLDAYLGHVLTQACKVAISCSLAFEVHIIVQAHTRRLQCVACVYTLMR